MASTTELLSRSVAGLNALATVLLLIGFVKIKAGDKIGHGKAMGAAYLPGYVEVADTAGREAFNKRWKTTLPTKPGLDAAAMFAPPTKLKALWLDRHNPAVSASYCDANEALKNMELVVLQNIFMTKTAEYAHVVLPVVAYGEEEVTFTSTERRIQHAVKAIEPPAGLPSAWQQIVEVANRMGATWSYPDSAAVLKEIAATVPEYEAVTMDTLTRGYGRQWPCTHNHPLGTPILFTEPEKKLRFAALHTSPPEDIADQSYPFVLSFGHSLYYWHQNTLIRHSETLKREYGILLLDYPEGFVEINSEDAKALSIRDGQRVKLVSPEGEALTFARVTSEVRHGIIYIPFYLQDVIRALGKECSGQSGKSSHVRLEKAL